ncbi:MAG: CinA family protein [Firmicutes bacterium]|nr:CinA family protein [Bacillota bacterium]
MSLASEVVSALAGRTLSTAESLTGGGIGAAITGIPGSSAVFKGGVISYTNEIKHRILKVDAAVLDGCGAVSAPVAEQMAAGARVLMETDFALSVTGLAGPGGDEYGNPVGTVYIGFSDGKRVFSRRFHFTGDREAVRRQTVEEALRLILEQLETE